MCLQTVITHLGLFSLTNNRSNASYYCISNRRNGAKPQLVLEWLVIVKDDVIMALTTSSLTHRMRNLIILIKNRSASLFAVKINNGGMCHSLSYRETRITYFGVTKSTSDKSQIAQRYITCPTLLYSIIFRVPELFHFLVMQTGILLTINNDVGAAQYQSS